MTSSTFRPVVTVDDNGTVTIDWADSYEATYTDQGEVTDDTGSHGAALDAILGAPDLPAWARLRRLADHIEGITDHLKD